MSAVIVHCEALAWLQILHLSLRQGSAPPQASAAAARAFDEARHGVGRISEAEKSFTSLVRHGSLALVPTGAGKPGRGCICLMSQLPLSLLHRDVSIQLKCWAPVTADGCPGASGSGGAAKQSSCSQPADMGTGQRGG